MKHGSKWPALCTCLEGNCALDLVVKFRGALPGDVFGFVAEHVAACLARDLGLESCETFAVTVSSDLATAALVSGYSNFARLIERSLGENIGSLLVTPGYKATLPSPKEFAKHRLLFNQVPPFDFLIQNLDRQRDNQNYLRKGALEMKEFLESHIVR